MEFACTFMPLFYTNMGNREAGASICYMTPADDGYVAPVDMAEESPFLRHTAHPPLGVYKN